MAAASSVPAVARMVAGLAFVAPPVIAGESGHQFLRVRVVDLVQESPSAWASQGRCHSSVVADDDVVASKDVGESVWNGHGRRLPASHSAPAAIDRS